jgi:siderophore synthetase component
MITPKEKAKELVYKFKPLCKDVKHTGILNGLATVMQDEVLNLLAAKMCAIIAVDEIINLCASGLSETKFWKQVKQEIEAL